MMDWRGLKFPDGEKHLPEWMAQMGQERAGLPCYQLHKYDAALCYCRQRRIAVDVGANVGLWSRVMAIDFLRVEAFEPVGEYADCWRKNVTAPNANLHEFALDESGGHIVGMACRTQGSCGDTTIYTGNNGEHVDDAMTKRLDEYEFENVDFIKADCEGYELFVMKGAADTIKRCRPVIIVEQKAGHGATFGLGDTAAVDFLRTLGMDIERCMSGDYIMVWP